MGTQPTRYAQSPKASSACARRVLYIAKMGSSVDLTRVKPYVVTDVVTDVVTEVVTDLLER